MDSKVFDEYNYWLGQSEDSNWNEYITEQVAKGVLGKFSAEDWNRLNDTILSREEYWQERSAAALGENRSTQAIEPKKGTDLFFVQDRKTLTQYLTLRQEKHNNTSTCE